MQQYETLDRAELGFVKVKWDDLIAPRGITLKFVKETPKQEPTAQDLIDSCLNGKNSTTALKTKNLGGSTVGVDKKLQ